MLKNLSDIFKSAEQCFPFLMCMRLLDRVRVECVCVSIHSGQSHQNFPQLLVSLRVVINNINLSHIYFFPSQEWTEN